MKIKLVLFISTLIFSSLFFTLAGCTGVSGKGKVSTNAITSSQPEDSISRIITIKKGEKVTLDSPDKFIQLWILINYEQKKWLSELSNSSESEDKIFKAIEAKRKDFFESYGITEKKFTSYSKTHYKEITEFMENNPDYKKAYEDSLQ